MISTRTPKRKRLTDSAKTKTTAEETTAAGRLPCSTFGSSEQVAQLIAEIKTTAAKSKRSGGGYSLFINRDGGGVYELHFHLSLKL